MVPIFGPYCELSFDFVVADSASEDERFYQLRSGIAPYQMLAKINRDYLSGPQVFDVGGKQYRVYRINCT